jgi:hypothetical protein
MTPVAIAHRWREAHGLFGRGGVIVLFHGEVQSWVNRLRNPEHWRPGCFAVDEEGRAWTAIAGDERGGADVARQRCAIGNS